MHQTNVIDSFSNLSFYPSDFYRIMGYSERAHVVFFSSNLHSLSSLVGVLDIDTYLTLINVTCIFYPLSATCVSG